MNKLWLPLAFVLSSVLAQAQPCRYAEFQPQHILDRLVYEAFEEKIAVLGVRHTIPGLPAGRTSFLSNGGVTAQVSLLKNPLKGSQSLSVTHPVTNLVLMQIEDTSFVCPTADPKTGAKVEGLCHRLEIWTDLQKPQQKSMPFVIYRGPRIETAMRYTRYDAEVSYATFRREFAEAYQWLLGAIANNLASFRPEGKNPFDRATWSLAADFYVAPYFERFGLQTSPKDKRVTVITGVAPSNFVYGRVIDRVKEAGFRYVDPQMRIDTRTAYYPVRPHIKGCR